MFVFFAQKITARAKPLGVSTAVQSLRNAGDCSKVPQLSPLSITAIDLTIIACVTRPETRDADRRDRMVKAGAR
jgi:hypothetical protein